MSAQQTDGLAEVVSSISAEAPPGAGRERSGWWPRCERLWGGVKNWSTKQWRAIRPGPEAWRGAVAGCIAAAVSAAIIGRLYLRTGFGYVFDLAFAILVASIAVGLTALVVALVITLLRKMQRLATALIAGCCTVVAMLWGGWDLSWVAALTIGLTEGILGATLATMFSRDFATSATSKRVLVKSLCAQQRHNPNPVHWYWRALITDMNEWVKDGTAPPPSTYPKIADGALVLLSKWAFPKIPGVNVPRDVLLAYRLDFGPQWKAGIVSKEPPGVGKAFTVLVPQVGADGNDLGAVRLPELQAPLATYTGWNLRAPSIGAPEQRISFLGSFLPFSTTAADREKTGDPRPSIAERYRSREEYMGRFSEAAQRLVRERFLLKEDLEAILQRGEREWNELAGQR